MAKKQTQIEENLNAVVREVEMPEGETKQRTLMKFGPKKLAIILLVGIALLGIYGSFHFYNKSKSLSANVDIEAQKETERLVGLLGKIIELPEGEMPTIATISDKEKLKDQPFFNQAQNGDILFAYTTSMKAILYRPTSNKIINVAPININEPQDLKEGTNR